MTLYFTNANIIILRNRFIGSSYRTSMSATFTAMAADIQPASPERTEFINGRPGHVFTGFVSVDHLIREGDRLVVLNSNHTRGKSYEVRGVNYWQGTGLLDHQELVLVDEDA